MEEEIDIEDNEEVRRIRKISSLKRENRRLHNSVSFQLGLHLTRAGRNPWRLFDTSCLFSATLPQDWSEETR